MLTPMNRAGGLPANYELRMEDEGCLVGGQDYRAGNLEDSSLREALGRKGGENCRGILVPGNKRKQNLRSAKRCKNLIPNPVERSDS